MPRLLLLVCLFSALCAGGPPAGAAGAPPGLVYLQGKGVKLTFLGKDGDLSIWLGEHDGQLQYFTVLPDGQRLLAGIVMDSAGRDLTADFLSKAVAAGTVHPQQQQPPPPPSAPAPDGRPDPAAALAAAAATHWMSFGRPGSPVVYMLADPECPYCKMAWAPALQMARDNKIELRLIPVGFIHGQQSMERLISILSAPSPARAWDMAETGGQVPAAAATDRTSGLIRDNHAFAERFGLQSTPAFLWMSAGGPRLNVGVPTGGDGRIDLSVLLR